MKQGEQARSTRPPPLSWIEGACSRQCGSPVGAGQVARAFTPARLARAALTKADDDPTLLMIAGHILAFPAQDYETAAALLDRSLDLAPTSRAPGCSGWVRCYVGEPEIAEAHFRTAKRRSPLDITTFRFESGLGLCMQDRHEEAVHWLCRAMNEDPFWTSTQWVFAAGPTHLARDADRRFTKLEPSYRIDRAPRLYRPSAGRDHFEGLRRAGLPKELPGDHPR